MAAFNRFNSYVADLGLAKINHNSDTHKVMLTNTAPVATNAVYTDITQISATNGYTTGGNTAALTSWSQSSGTAKLVLQSPATWTASGGSMPTFRYVVLYDDTSATKPLVGWWDYGAGGVTLASGETFTATFDGTNGVLQIVSP